MNRSIIVLLLCGVIFAAAQHRQRTSDTIDLGGFQDSAHHWYDINDEVPKLFPPVKGQPKYGKQEVAAIADNILLYQRANGGWPKNYDMQAVLTDEQKRILIATKKDISLTTFDNGATHSQIAYLAKAWKKTKDKRYSDAALQGLDFVLSAQYPNGGFPQFYPDTSGYRKYITFNDGAMGGVMEVLRDVATSQKQYAFVDDARRKKCADALQHGIECILRCQISVEGNLTAWCQQHDHRTFAPQNARTFEPKAICSQESADLVLFLMSLDHPDMAVRRAVNSAVDWFRRSALTGIRMETIEADSVDYKYHSTHTDRVVVKDPSAPRIWSRMYEIATNVPLFCNRTGVVVYSLAEVDRERRTGYKWYGYEPETVLQRYDDWSRRWNSDATPQ